MRTRLFVVMAVGLACAGACSLNPQPLPPATDDTRDKNDAGTHDGTPTSGSDSGSGGGGADASFGQDAGAPPPSDGGTNGIDAEADAASDAPTDAPLDAPADADDAG